MTHGLRLVTRRSGKAACRGSKRTKYVKTKPAVISFSDRKRHGGRIILKLIAPRAAIG